MRSPSVSLGAYRKERLLPRKSVISHLSCGISSLPTGSQGELHRRSAGSAVLADLRDIVTPTIGMNPVTARVDDCDVTLLDVGGKASVQLFAAISAIASFFAASARTATAPATPPRPPSICARESNACSGALRLRASRR